MQLKDAKAYLNRDEKSALTGQRLEAAIKFLGILGSRTTQTASNKVTENILQQLACECESIS